MIARAAALVAFAAALGAAPAGAAVSLVQVGTFARPVYVTAPPGDTAHVLVVEQGGSVRFLDDGAPFLDLTGATVASGERGLLSIAFAADYATSRKLYAYYTSRADGAITIDEYTAAADGRSVDTATRRQLLRVPHDQQTNHNGGQLQIGPDGALYAGTGDGGSGGDPSGNGQDTTKAPPTVVNGVNHDWRLGKLLRVNVAGGDPELVSIGLRNPFRFSFDRETADLTIGDVGQNAVEEIDFAPAPARGQGLNFGWDLWEGDRAYTGTPSRDGFTFPVITHTHDDGWCSIIGGYVVRDPALPDLLGQYVYGDYCKNEVWAARLSASGASDVRALGLPAVASMSSFGEDACGRVYVASLDGPVYRLSDSGACVVPAPAPGGGTTTPSAPPPAADTTPPGLELLNRRAQRVLRTGRLSLWLGCDELCELRIGARLAGRTLRASRTLAAGARVRIDLRLSQATRAAIAGALRRNTSISAVLTLRAVDTAGNARTRSGRVRARR